MKIKKVFFEFGRFKPQNDDLDFRQKGAKRPFFLGEWLKTAFWRFDFKFTNKKDFAA